MTNHETVKHLRDAQRRLRSVLVANADRLSTPFTDDPSKNPWDTYLRPAMRGLQEAVNAACEALAAPAAVSVPPPAPRAPGLRAAAAEADRAGGLYAARGDEARAGAAFSLMEALTAMADCPSCDAGIEHDVHCPTPETHNAGCGCDTDLDALGPCVAGEQQNETPEGEPGCAHCGGDHSWDDCEAYTALVAAEAPHTETPDALPFTHLDDDGDQLEIGAVMASTYDGEAPAVYVATEQHQGDQVATVYVRPERVERVVAALRSARRAAETLPAVVARPGKEPAAGVRQDGAQP